MPAKWPSDQQAELRARLAVHLPCAVSKSSSLILFPRPLPATPPRQLTFCAIFAALATPARAAGAFNYTGRIMCQQAAAPVGSSCGGSAASSNCQHLLTRPATKSATITHNLPLVGCLLSLFISLFVCLCLRSHGNHLGHLARLLCCCCANCSFAGRV